MMWRGGGQNGYKRSEAEWAWPVWIGLVLGAAVLTAVGFEAVYRLWWCAEGRFGSDSVELLGYAIATGAVLMPVAWAVRSQLRWLVAAALLTAVAEILVLGWVRGGSIGTACY